ncbi:MAG: type II secretion system F family protein [Candidatus Woesearchaeota archaeon]
MITYLTKKILSKNNNIKKQLRMAKINKTSEQVVSQALKFGLMMSACMTLLAFFFLDSNNQPLIFLPIIFLVLWQVFYKYNLMGIQGKIIKRRKEIDRDVLFAGRFLLVKLNSGKPLINALVEASKSYGTSSTYFKDIIKDIELGKPIEIALQEESEYSPSLKFRKILFQISNALKIGIDVTEFLDATLTDIANEQMIEIQRYGKKLNSLTLFYMLIAVVLPSLGHTIFIIILSLASIDIDAIFFGTILFFLALLQGVFLVMYKSIRPDINI